MTNVYISPAEYIDTIQNLTPTEATLYATVKGMVAESPQAAELKNTALAARLDTTEHAISKLKYTLKKKGYLVITFGKDGDGDLTAQVYIGKDQVELYNLGLKVEISDAKAYRDLVKKFPFTDPTLSAEKRADLVQKANEYAKQFL